MRPILAIAVLLPLALPSRAWAQGRVREDFEGPEPRLKYAGGDAAYRIDVHQLAAGARSGSLCEHLQVEMGRGTTFYMALAAGPARMIDELTASLWLKADRAGPRVLGRIVLPHTPDPQTGQAATVLVAGQSYRDVGRWQQLRLGSGPERLPNLLRGALQPLQARLGAQIVIDIREAYLDQIVLNLYAGGGRLRVWADELELAGVVGRQMVAPTVPRGQPPGNSTGFDPGPAPRPKVTSAGSQLLLDGRPFFTRAIQYQGEALELLKRLGFNTVQLSRPPSPELLREAAGLGLWLITPPPAVGQASRGDFAAITSQWNPVLAWDLGEGLAESHFETFRQSVRSLRHADRGRQTVARPVICDPITDCRAFSRHANILRPSRRPIGTTLELPDYLLWLRNRPRLARPGTPMWTTIQTQTSPAYVEQVRRLVPGGAPRITIDPEQIRLLTYSALAVGVRGLVFDSRSRLDANDAETRRRAMALELLNLELDLVEPWAAAGTLSASVPCSRREVQASLLQTDKARLVLASWLAPRGQWAGGQSAGNNVSFIVPGVPVSHDAYEMTPAGMRRLTDQRVTRGVHVKLDQFGPSSLILFTGDPLVLRGMQQRVDRTRQRAAELQYELSVDKSRQTEQLHQQLAALQLASPQGPQYLATARADLKLAAAAASRRQYDETYRRAQRAMRPLRIIERAYWDQAVSDLSPVASPLAGDTSTLPQHWHFVRRMGTASWALNQLPGGDCENVDAMRRGGWRVAQHATMGVQAGVDVISGNPHAGQFCLRLKAQPADPEMPPGLVETPPMWVTTAAVPVSTAGVVRIRGWVRVPAPITGSVDGLMIYDSLAGPALAQRLDATPGWRQFTLYRATGPARHVQLTFALTGLGEAWIDDVTIEPLLPPGSHTP